MAEVVDGGPAALAGLRAGDLVVSADLEPVTDVGSLQRRLLAASIGRSMPVTVLAESVAEVELPCTSRPMVASRRTAPVSTDVVPASTRMPYQRLAPAVTHLKVAGLAAVPCTRSVPWTMSSTRTELLPEPRASLAAAMTSAPGSTVSVTPAGTVTSPVRL